jgi:hemerythrin-like metal-binding protein
MSNPAPFFVWKPAFDLEIPVVDAEHRRFFELMNELYAAMVRGDGDKQLRATLTNLTEYAAYHFGGEEDFLASVGFPELHVQRKQHAWFLEGLEGLVLKDSDASRAALTFMKNWFLEHILGTDKKYAAWLVGSHNCHSVVLHGNQGVRTMGSP